MSSASVCVGVWVAAVVIIDGGIAVVGQNVAWVIVS